jgi:hypothetical protein
MNSILRWYQYIVSAFSLQAVTWAVIALLRNLLTPALNPISGSVSYATETMALQLAVIIIGLPLFLVHWVWAERAQEQDEESFALVRPFYIFFMMSAFLIPFLTNSTGFVASALRLMSRETLIIPSYSSQLPDRANLVYTLVAMAVLTLMWFFHFRLAKTSYAGSADAAPVTTIRRIHIYLFSAVGLAMSSIGATNLLRWLSNQFTQEAIGSGTRSLITVVSLLITGIPLWVLFWYSAQANFFSPSKAEKSSLLRKFYLYLVIFLSVMAFVSAATIYLAGIFRRLLGLDPRAGAGIILSVIIISSVIWVYHAWVLREDTQTLPEGERQAAVRRLYWYLVTGVGLLALLIGIGGVISLLISTSGKVVVSRERELLAYYAAALSAGLVVWIIPWIKIQREINQSGIQGRGAREDRTRKLYLYFFLLLATLTFLGSMVFVLSEMLNWILSAQSSVVWNTDMSLALAYALLAVFIWLYHGYLLRQDRWFSDQFQIDLAVDTHVVLVIKGNKTLGKQLLSRLQADIPGINLKPLFLDPEGAEEPDAQNDPVPLLEILAQADLIVGSWTMVSPYLGKNYGDATLSQAINNSPAPKLLIPHPIKGWEWSSLEHWDIETAVDHAVTSVKQFIAGEEVHLVRPRSAASIILIVLAILFVLFLLLTLGVSFA